MDRAATNRPPQTKEGSKNIIKYLKRAATFTITARPYSPGHDRGFSGPIAPLVPAAARRRGRKDGRGKGFDIDQEPTSPKVSCMGQVKKRKDHMWRLASTRGEACHAEQRDDKNNKKEKSSSSSSTVVSMILKGKFRRDQNAAAKLPPPPPPPVAPVQAPSIGEMKKLASVRDKLGGFDWKAASINGDDDSSYYSADEREPEEEVKEAEEAEDEISSSGPAMMEEEQRKETNLWKRRTMKSPPPLQLS